MWGPEGVQNPDKVLLKQYPTASEFAPLEFAQLMPGEYHPRVWRNGISVSWIEDSAVAFNKTELAVIRERIIALHRIQRQLAEIFEVITPTPSHAQVHGEAIGQILTLAATETERLLKECYVANSPPTDRGKLFRELKMGNLHSLHRPMRLGEWEVCLPYYDDWPPFRPFADWTQAAVPAWWTAYNSRKHNPNRRDAANLESAISSVAAVRILLEVEFGPGIEALLPPAGPASISVRSTPSWSGIELYSSPTNYHVQGDTLREKLLFP
jgi:hypothetical protein